MLIILQYQFLVITDPLLGIIIILIIIIIILILLLITNN